jgi:hypothetical protein
MGDLTDRLDALTDAACEMTEPVAAYGWSPTAATDTLGAVEVLLQLLTRLGPAAATALEPARTATTRVRTLIADGTLPPRRRCGPRGAADGTGRGPATWIERDMQVVETLWWTEQRGLGRADRP